MGKPKASVRYCKNLCTYQQTGTPAFLNSKHHKAQKLTYIVCIHELFLWQKFKKVISITLMALLAKILE